MKVPDPAPLPPTQTEPPPTVDANPRPASRAAGRSPTDANFIGRYRLLQALGEGGMGTVYKAEQLSPVKRTVAIKVIKAGFDSAEIITRFESERQALARMSHPNVAQML